ncbi:MAG: ribonuclease P protein component [Oscillospiraceae bacterium]|jgi:ribonuclease P protein component|nr:ribonuclease P protein component [Oscillospiraceae bacterium]
MRFTQSLRENRDFRRLYARGRTTAGGLLAVYVRPNRTGGNRLGLTVSGKLGGAVVRNRVRRRLKEAYRLREASLLSGFDLVVVARSRAVTASYWELDRELARLLARMGVSRPKP